VFVCVHKCAYVCVCISVRMYAYVCVFVYACAYCVYVNVCLPKCGCVYA